ncbi:MULTISPECIES: RAxF-45 family protein [Lysinibacillus]|uniref:RAxF-45 family protein n=1 Tax=Lysinibacillus pakistanensis TaxID=759811 RepID=A0AAX3X2F7_9BACI|nr:MULTISPECIES: RAxF-45 family protein [Lysinibacillus]MDM5232570.1 RAxF-45 family protein [Lysinibacillus pakistanensis]WHY48077.1 RAxF-45 family protein [Lysinibacillus pakistanensis]WHY53089.1 RAxF-45 family protein [Lysinibacillus pakistanensis]
MKQNATKTCVKVDTAMYFARVITFDFANNGRGLSIFKQNQIITNVAD